MATAEAGLELPIGLTEQKFLQQLARIEARAIKAAQRGEQAFVKSNQQISRSFGQMSGAARGQLQNVSFQLQDIFVQISSGTSASRALGQQLPQLLSGFGAFGAVLGLVASAAIPLAANFLNAGEEADSLADSIDNLETAVSAYREAVDAANAPTAELVEKYGVATQAAAALLEQLSRIRRLEATAALSARATALRENFAGIREAVALVDQELAKVGGENSNIDALNQRMIDGFGLSIEQARTLNQLLADANAAKSVNEKADAMNALAGFLDQAVTSSNSTNQSLLEGARAAAEGALSAYELADATKDAEFAADGVAGAASGIAPVIDDASAAAANLTANLGAAMAQLNAVVAGVQAAQRQALATARIKLETVGDPAGRAAGLARQDYLEKSGTAAYAAIRGGSMSSLTALSDQASVIAEGARQVAAAEEAVSAADAAYQKTVAASSAGGRKAGRGGRKSGGGREEKPFFEDIERDIQSLNRQIEVIGMSAGAVAELEAKWTLLDKAKRRGLTVDAQLSAEIDRQSASIGRLADQYERAKDQADFYQSMQESAQSGMIDAIVEGENLSGVLEDVAKSFAKAALQAALFGQGPFGGGGGGLLGGLFGGIFGGFRAGGGSVSAGRAYVVGENGPELMVPGASGTILNPAQIERSMGASPVANGGAVDVRVYMDQNGNWQAAVENISGKVSARVVAANSRAQQDQQYLRGGR